MTLFFYIIIGLITFVAFLHALAKKKYDLNKTIVINKPRAEIYGFIRQLKKQKEWLPWIKNEGNILKYKGEDGKVGAVLYWRGNNHREGLQKITKLKDGRILEVQLLFIKPRNKRGVLYLAVKEINPTKCKIIMGIKGAYSFPESIYNFLPGMEYSLGKELIIGLNNLKKILEKN